MMNTARKGVTKGFTLVELLVVIAIIGMLVGLLFPAIQAARESGRRTTCMNNMRNVGFAINTYDNAKGRYPNTIWTQQVAGVNYWRSLVFAILPNIERADVYERYSSYAGSFPVTNDPQVGELYLEIATCPSDPQLSGGGTAFCYNIGNRDFGSQPGDRANGVFSYRGAPGANSSNFVSTKDGTSNTLMMSENMDAGKWQGHDDGSTFHSNPWVMGFHWDNYPPNQWPTYRINANKGASPGQVSNGWNYARPSSNHPELVNAYLCSGTVRPLRHDMDYRVLVALMTPHGAQCTASTSVGGANPNRNPTNVAGRVWTLDDSQW